MSEQPRLRITEEELAEPVRLKTSPETVLPPIKRGMRIFAATIGYPAALRKKKRQKP